MRAFFKEGVRRRPNELVRWYRDGRYFFDGETLIWEYPRLLPDDGEQIDICEALDLDGELIQRHRVYWGFRAQMVHRTGNVSLFIEARMLYD